METEDERLQDLRSKATKLLLTEEYAHSIKTYSQIISLCQDPISKNPDGPHLTKIQRTLCLAFSNRAEARARLFEFSEALNDCEEALRIEKSHLKSLLCKGKILLSLNRYAMALECFKLANIDPVANENCDSVNEFLLKCKKLECLSRTGVFDISDWVLSGFKGKMPEFAEYIGPVEIKKSEISGRGLFVTKNEESGTLMFVTKAVAVDRAIVPNDCGENARLVIWKNFVDNVVEITKKCSEVGFLMSNLSAGKDEGSLGVPELGFFRPDANFDSGEKLDMDKMLSILDVNSILEDGISSKVLGKNAEYQGIGLWGLASLINHSCDPNVRRLHVGDYVIVHACRDLKAGEELTFAYFDVLSPLSKRREMAKNWEFVCKCKRCEFEDNLCCKQELIKDLEILLGNGQVDMMGSVVCRLEEGIRRWVVKGKEKGYLRASFWLAYLGIYGSDKMMRKWGRKVPSIESVVDSVVESVGSDERVLKVFMEGLKRNNGGFVEMENGMKLGRGVYGKVMKKQALRSLIQFGAS